VDLLIDIGNTNLRWTRHDGEQPWEIDVVRHGGGVPLDLLACWEQLDPPERILVSNVGGDMIAAALARVARALWRRDLELLRTRATFGAVRIAYEEPARLGVDRWLALVGAHARWGQACLILDAGTAATFDLLLADGRHLGGLILPGIEMMRRSLLVGTHVPRVEADPSGEPWATDTASAIAAGSVQALAALADRLYGRLAAYDRLNERPSEPPLLILTGGDGERVASALDRPYELAPDLVLRGIQCVMEEPQAAGTL
jgi:type III pantothenate kinase